ncbi:MAG: glycosyltransferase [Akkermansia sp.]|nr:glycosyltransferase [Akkermansia sp.]
MSEPLISVIVPVYKAEKHLRRGLDSLLQQTDERWEAICINDGSPDNSGAILDEYARRDPRFRVFHRENQGVSAARNLGIEMAKGDFVTFLDADDWFSPGLIAELHHQLHREQVDIILFHAQVEYAAGIPPCPALENNLRLKQEGEYAMEPGCITYSIGTCWGKAYRKVFLESNGLRFPLNMRQEDEVFYRCSMAVARHIYCSAHCGYHYLQTGDSYMHTMVEPCSSYLLYLRGVDLAYTFYREHGCLPVWEETLLQFLFSQMAGKQPYVSRGELRTMRRETSAFLATTDIPAHFAHDYRVRYLSDLSPLRDLFISRRREGEVYGFGKLELLKIRYQNGRFERWATPFGKLMRCLRKGDE